jgi:hypothetical protein
MGLPKFRGNEYNPGWLKNEDRILVEHFDLARLGFYKRSYI